MTYIIMRKDQYTADYDFVTGIVEARDVYEILDEMYELGKPYNEASINYKKCQEKCAIANEEFFDAH